MAKWILLRSGIPGPIDYPALGFTARPGDVYSGASAPDAYWHPCDEGTPETVDRYMVPGGDDAALAALVDDADSAVSTSLKATYVTQASAETITGTKTFRAPLISRANETTGQVSAKQVGDTSDALINWKHDGDYGYLIHMTAGSSLPDGGALIGLGVDAGLGAGLHVSAKASGVGIRVSVTNTATSSGQGIRLDHSGTSGVGAIFQQTSATAATLVSFRANPTASGGIGAGTKLVTFNDKDGEAGAIYADTGVFQWQRQFQLDNTTGLGWMQMKEQTSAPNAPAANAVRIYAQDNGSGKTQLVARFNTGAVQILATEP